MAFTGGRIGSCDVVKRVSSSSPMRKMSSVCKTRKRAGASISDRSSVEADVDFDKCFDLERCLDSNECMWLSSESAYPSSSFFVEHRLSGPFHLYANDWLISWLSTLADSYLHLVPEKTIPAAEEITFQEGLEEKREFSLPLNSVIASSESFRFSCEEQIENSTPFRINLDSSSQIPDMERISFGVSLMNLDGEDSEWISDTEAELGSFQAGFPSPSYRSSCSSGVKSCTSRTSVPTESREDNSNYDHLSSDPASEAAGLEDFSADEPLFWPFEHENCWSCGEAWNCFIMSPRKDMTKARNPEATSLGSTKLQYDRQKALSKDRSTSRLVLKSGSTASNILDSKKRKNNNRVAKKINNMPSRLQNSDKLSIKIVPLEMGLDDTMEASDSKVPILKPSSMHISLFQDDFPANEELPIEMVLGLGEFDGHEGVDLDLSEDIFLLEEYK